MIPFLSGTNEAGPSPKFDLVFSLSVVQTDVKYASVHTTEEYTLPQGRGKRPRAFQHFIDPHMGPLEEGYCADALLCHGRD